MESPLSPTEKPCARCGELVKLSGYDKDVTKPDGLKSVCKPCRAAKGNADMQHATVDMLRRLDGLLVKNLAESKAGGPDVPHLVEIYESIIRILGGVEGLAQQYVATYLAANPGSQTRERLLGNLTKMGAVVSDNKKVEMPVELMSDQDLEREIKSRKKKMIVDGDVVDRTPPE